MKQIKYFLFFTVLLYSCNKQNNLPVKTDSHPVIIDSQYNIIDCTDLLINVTTDLVADDSFLYWIDNQQENLLFYLNPLENPLQIYSSDIKLGKGPGEYGYISSLKRFDHQVSFFDIINKKIFVGNKNIFNQLFDLSKVNETITDITIIDTMNVLISGILCNARFGISNNTIEIIQAYNEFPCNKNLNELTTELKNMGYLNIGTFNNSKYSNIVYDSGIIEFFNINNNKAIKVKEHIFSENKFKINDFVGNITIEHDNNNTGFIDVYSTNDFVFALFSSVSWAQDNNLAALGDWIFIFSWEGDFVKACRLKYPINRFALFNNSILGFTILDGNVKLIQYFYE